MTDRTRQEETALRREAIAWVVRLRDADAADWEAFERWMAEDARAADIYCRVAEADADVAEALARPRRARTVMPAPEPARPRWLGPGAALAASLLAAIAGYSIWSAARPDADILVASVRPGTVRTLDLGDGSWVVLNGGSRLRIDHSRPRMLRLEAGEARFTVVHDTSRPFVVDAGRARVVDLGTVFAITHDGQSTFVAVAEGRVRFDYAGASDHLEEGETLRLAADGRVVRGRMAPSDVGAWADGRLAYDDAPLDAVAADLARATGLRVSTASSLKARRFSGGFALGARDADTIRRAAHVIGVEARALNDGWILEGAGSLP